MISKVAISIIANTIANNKHREYCNELDARLMNSLNGALEDRHISVKRQNEIVNVFCELM